MGGCSAVFKRFDGGADQLRGSTTPLIISKQDEAVLKKFSRMEALSWKEMAANSPVSNPLLDPCRTDCVRVWRLKKDISHLGAVCSEELFVEAPPAHVLGGKETRRARLLAPSRDQRHMDLKKFRIPHPHFLQIFRDYAHLEYNVDIYG